MFAQDVIVEALVCGQTDMSTNNFGSQLKALHKPEPQTGHSHIETQYRLLHKLTPSPDDVIRNVALGNPHKNRSDRFLPGIGIKEMCIDLLLLADKSRVPLHKLDNNYINASFINVRLTACCNACY